MFGKQRESRREQLLGRRGGGGEVEEKELEMGDRRGSYTEVQTKSEACKELRNGNLHEASMSQSTDGLLTKEGDRPPDAGQTQMYTQTHSWSCTYSACGMHACIPFQ